MPMPTLSNSFSIRNLSPLNFVRCRYTSSVTPAPPPADNASPIRSRARWLATGLGDAAAHYAAARSYLHSADETLLIAIVPVSSPVSKISPSLRRKEPIGTRRALARDADLWIFAARRMENVQADNVLRHVADVFHVSEIGTWRGESDGEGVDDIYSVALVSALHDAVHQAFQTHVCSLSIGSELLYVPSANTVYRLRLAMERVSGEATVGVSLSILAPMPDMRLVEITDLDRSDVQVLISPVGVRARLVPGRRAGEALAAQVVDRWDDAGLGKGEDEEVVVFVSVGNAAGSNSSFPIPMRCLVILKIGGKEDYEEKEGVAYKRKIVAPVDLVSETNGGNRWHSLKRPRSPSTDVEALERAAKFEAIQLPQGIPQTQPVIRIDEDVVPVVNVLPDRTLDAAMLDRAIASVVSAKTPLPVLSHPLAVPVSQLGYIATNVACGGSGTARQDLIGSTGGVAVVSTPAPVSRTGFCVGGTESSVVSLPMNTDAGACGVDDGDGNNGGAGVDVLDSLVGGSEGGGGFDMDEVGVFDDDVTQFFGSAEVTPSLPAASTFVLGKNVSPDALQTVGKLPLSTKNLESVSRGSGVDEHVTAQPDLGPPNTTCMAALRAGARFSLPTVDTTAVWFTMLNETDITRDRPCTPQREEEVLKFIERDVAKRRRVRTRLDPLLSPERKTIKKPCSFSTHDRLQRATVVPARDLYYPKRVMTVFNKVDVLSSALEAPDSYSSTVDEGASLESSADEAIEVNDSQAMMAVVIGKEIAEEDVQVPVLLSDSVSHGDFFLQRAQYAASSVAVDCAGACFVILSAEVNCESYVSSPWIFGVSLVAKVPSFFDSRDISFGGAGTTSSGMRSSNVLGKAYRCDSLEALMEKDDKALECLFQMQIIGAPEIQLLPLTGVPLRVDKPADIPSYYSKAGGSGISDGSVVVDALTALGLSAGHPALVRRALQGFSSVVQNGCVLERESEDDGMDTGEDGETKHIKYLSISGPLPVSDVPPKEIPRVCVGFRGDWVETGSGILPLWEKSGLEPYACPKSVQFAVLAPNELADDVRFFFRDVSAGYEECSLGRHSPMPFDSLSLITNSVPVPLSELDSRADPDKVTSAESRMVQQYHLAAAGLATKFTSVSHDSRKSDAIGPNFVIYVVSPFPRHRRAAIAALFHAVTPLVTCIPNTAVSSGLSPPLPPGLISSPWRLASSAQPFDHAAQPAPHSQPSQLGMGSSNSLANSALLAQSVSGVAIGLTVRMLPREAVERYPLDLATHSYPTRVLLRSQLVKSVAFAVYGSLRSRRLRRTMYDSESLGGAPSSESSELLSPMTPDIATTGSPSNANVSAAMPLPPSPRIAGERSATGDFLNPDRNLSTFLYDPAFVLAGVGERTSQAGLSRIAALHLCYTLLEEQSKCIFAWTDSRGETLDVGVMVMPGQAPGLRFSKLFESMWKQGHQWWVPYVNHTCVTIAKVGSAMSISEKEEWQSVVRRFIASSNARAEFAGDRIETRLRFPNVRGDRSGDSVSEPEGVDIMQDAATPATPAAMPAVLASASTGFVPASVSGNDGAEFAADTSFSTLRSVTILSVVESSIPDLVASEARRDFVFLAGSAGGCEAKAVMIVDVAPGKNARQLELSMLAHFGVCRSESETVCGWDGRDAASILRHICSNFDGLRTASSPPCWPRQLWLSSYPIHVDAVWKLRRLLSSFSFGAG